MTVLVQWWSLTAVAALIGAVALDVAVLPRAGVEIVAARRRLARWIVVWAVMTLIAASVWVGGLVGLAAVVLRPKGEWSRAAMATVARRFSRLAGVCLLLVVVTGIGNAWVQLPFVSALWTTFYGRVLLAKVAIALVIIAIGALNRYTIVPGLDDRRGHGLGYRLFRSARYVAGRRAR